MNEERSSTVGVEAEEGNGVSVVVAKEEEGGWEDLPVRTFQKDAMLKMRVKRWGQRVLTLSSRLYVYVAWVFSQKWVRSSARYVNRANGMVC